MWHSLEIDEIYKKLETEPGGLGEKEAQKRLAAFGPNKLPEEKKVSRLKIFFGQLKSPLVYILLLAGLVAALLNDYVDAGIILAAVFLNVLIGFFQENKTNNILTELKKVVKDRAVVIRDGNQKEISGTDVVPGDVIILNPGEKIPADGRLIETHNLKINEASLTGEWIPALKKTEIMPADAPLADRDNMVYMGCTIESGWGKALVTETGVRSELGKIAKLVGEAKEEKTPYQKKVIHFSKVWGGVILLLCVGLFVLGVATGRDMFEMLITSVAVAVAATPEGLPAAVTVTFAFGMREILKKRGLVKELVAAEILGSTSVICTDKTGTLTEAKMQVDGIFPHFHGEYTNKSPGEELDGASFQVLKVAVLASNAFIENPDDELHQWVVRGASTEKAVLLAGIQIGLDKKELLRQYVEIDRMVFDSAYKYSASLFRVSEDETVLYVLGSPELVLKKSNFLEIDGQQVALDESKRKEFADKIEELTSRGARVVAAAYQKMSDHQKTGLKPEMISGLVFTGLISLRDPLRKEAKRAIELCRRAGMNMIIVTGDHKLTAKAIADELGLGVEHKNIIEGSELDKMSDDEFEKRAKGIKVYARVEPRHKLRIIDAWQKMGRVVAMTGDGINDAPALRSADIGVALGSGTEVAKEASDIILLSDNFDILVTAVGEGRRIMDNVRKIVVYLLEGSFTEILLISLSVIFRFPLPLLPGQILWNNLILDTPLAMALTTERKEKDVMERKPEAIDHPLLTREMKIFIFAVGILTDLVLFSLFAWLWISGVELPRVRTIIFAGLAIDSLFLIFACRNLKKNIWQFNPFSNMYVNFSVLLGFLMLAAAIYFPFLRELLKTVALGWREWTLVFGIGAVNLLLVEFAKMALNRSRAS
ncbi:MAG: hypothetical protein COT61_01240 [Candidatus Portnoybacteria bacterium CG09_land_8_20_14_0_10_44_13]|uniref:Cation-transporting P-type ATPase N-terminal domain-containing protein n=1 Tax=Candidatus Portnoybacteria bacterium CG09_land_8_20_14_0_10_44_13 TaxID=1974811 RepID=A0A2H0WYF1_9BACT|nr:MAG: hypothetical protein COT61_01240 [Candidatus Portnoybacteria bacterium CG09_land_8_20_14_0_10_44_13]